VALRSISLFSGCGGLENAIELALGDVQPICYVERDAEAAEILANRIHDGAIPDAPIWSDITTFPAGRFRGMADLICGGFPCVDISVAGKRAGIVEGNRSGLWFEYVRTIREIRPLWIAIENVPPVLAFPAGGIVFGELSKLGFDAIWGSVRASSVGASHIRKRVFIFAWRRGMGDSGCIFSSGARGHTSFEEQKRWHGSDDENADLADTQCSKRREDTERSGRSGEGIDGEGQETSRIGESVEVMGDSGRLQSGAGYDSRRSVTTEITRNEGHDWSSDAGGNVDDAADARLIGWRSEQDRSPRDKARLQESGRRCDDVANSANQRFQECRSTRERELSTESRDGLDHRPEQCCHKLANTEESGSSQRVGRRWSEAGQPRSERDSYELADSDEQGLQIGRRDGCNTDASREAGTSAECDVNELADAKNSGCETRFGDGLRVESGSGKGFTACFDSAELPLFAPGPSDPRWPQILAQHPDLAPAESRFDRFVLSLRRAGILPDGMECTPERVGQYLRSACLSEEVKSKVRQLAHGSSADRTVSRTDQLRAIGNMVCPIQGASAFIELLRRIGVNSALTEYAED